MEEDLLSPENVPNTNIITELDILTIMSATSEATLNRIELILLLIAFNTVILMYFVLRRNRSDI